MSSSVEDWLRSLGFIHYTQAFLDNGYDELEICKEIGKEDLDAIGVRNFKDRTDILNAVARLKQAGTAVYFVLEGNDESEQLQAQPERETYPPIQFKMMLRDKLEEDKIDLTSFPYSLQDGSEGTLDTLVTIYADKFYTYEDQVLTALRNLRQRQVEASFEDSAPQPMPPVARVRPSSARHSSKYKTRNSEDREDDEGRGAASEDEYHHRSISSEDTTSPTRVGMIPADYLDVDSPAQRKKSKKRRKVERNTKLSRSLDSLKELHVNVESKPRDRESSSFKSRPFRFKWLHGSKKKHHSVSEPKKQALEKRPSNPITAQDYDLLASAMTMSEEDRMALMIMVKQGELTVEEAVEQLKRYEEDCRKVDNYLKPKEDIPNDDEKSENKPKLKRGLFGRSTKRKSGSRPSSSSDFIACEMTTMSEEERINLMRSVKSGELSVNQALKRFISYEEKHKKSDSDDNAPSKPSPRLPKSGGFSRISIKRVSGVISSSFKLPSSAPNEPNAVFYTGEDGTIGDGVSADGSLSSGDEVLGTDSPAPSPKHLLVNIQGLNKSQRSSSSSVDSMDKIDEKPAPSATLLQQPNFLSEMKVVLGKQTRQEDVEGSEDGVHPNLQSLRLCNKYEKPIPPPPERKTSLPSMDAQKVSPSLNNSGSPKRTAPEVPHRPGSGSAVTQPHRPAPPVPIRPSPKSANDQGKPTVVEKTDGSTRAGPKSPADKSKINNLHVESTKRELTKCKGDESRTQAAVKVDNSPKGQARSEPAKLGQNVVETKGVVLRRPAKPPPLPPRPTSSSSTEGAATTDAYNLEIQTGSRPSVDVSSQSTGATQVPSKKPPIPEASGKPVMKPQLKPKPKPRPRPRPKMGDTSDKQDDDAYNEVPPPRPVDQASEGKRAQTSDSEDEPYNQVPPPRPVRASREKMEEASDSDDEPYNEVPLPRPVKPPDTSEKRDKPYNQLPPPRPVRISVEKAPESSDDQDEPYTEVPVPRPVGRMSPGGTRTQGETSRSEVNTSMEREKSEPLAAKRNELKVSGDKMPVPAPRIKRASHSLEEMVDRKIHLEHIDLTQEPYSDQTGCWGVPVNLVDRYAEELHRSHGELAGIIDRIRVRKLKQAGRQAVPCNVSEIDFTREPLGKLGSMSDWLTSLGLPMYIKNLAEVEYDDMESMPYMEERHFIFAGISDPRHMKRLLASVERMPR